jgi:hypothetical protein
MDRDYYDNEESLEIPPPYNPAFDPPGYTSLLSHAEIRGVNNFNAYVSLFTLL